MARVTNLVTMSELATSHGILKRVGLKITKNREQVLGILRNSERPMNHQEIMEQLPKGQSWDRVTIYRALADLEEKKLLTTMLSADRITYFELKEDLTSRKKHHGHVICDSCGKIQCVDDLEKQIPKQIHGYKIRTMEVTFYGICKECQ